MDPSRRFQRTRRAGSLNLDMRPRVIPMHVTEDRIKTSTLVHIEGSAGEGAELVGVRVDAAPLEIVTAVNQFVSKQQRRRRSSRVDNWTDRALPLGSLWGCQLVRQFGWEWSGVIFHEHGDSKAVGVFAKDRSLAVYPWHFIFGSLENKAPVTILLSFNMLAAGRIPAQRAKAYVNLMEGVHHIVPPA